MEGDRKAFSDEISSKLKKQKKIIVRLKIEKENILEDIKIATCADQKKQDVKISVIVKKLIQKHNNIIEEIQKIKIRLEEIDQQIKKTEKEVHKLKLKEITEKEYQERVKSGKKSIELLENKLETMVKRFCTVLTENRQIREEIDHLLKERTRFNAIWEKLISDFNIGKKFMLDLIEQATLAYDQREEWCSKLQSLKIRTHNEVIVHSQEMREMHRELDHGGKLKEFLIIKSQKRVMKDLEQKEIKKKEGEKENMEQQIQVYEEILLKIRQFCENQNDINKIATRYLKQEEENFALFNYINELNHELELLEDSIKEMQSKITEQKILSEQRAQKQSITMDVLNTELDTATKTADTDENNLKTTIEELTQILTGIQAIFVLIECNFSPVLYLLDQNADINEDNVMIYLGLVEKQISDIITTTYFKEKSVCIIFFYIII